MDVSRKFVAELIGTFWLVFAGCGSALLAAGFTTPDGLHHIGIGFAGVSLAFGLTVVSMAYGIGHISGAHLNPAVTLGAFLAGRIHVKDVVPYFIAQFAGGVIAAFLLFMICSGALRSSKLRRCLQRIWRRRWLSWQIQYARGIYYRSRFNVHFLDRHSWRN